MYALYQDSSQAKAGTILGNMKHRSSFSGTKYLKVVIGDQQVNYNLNHDYGLLALTWRGTGRRDQR